MGLKFKGNRREPVYSAMLNNLAYANLNSVLTGCEVNPSTPNAMTIDVNSGKVFFGNDIINVIASTNTLTIDTEPSSNIRTDLVLVDNTGTLSILKGTASAIPATPNYDPDNYIVLAIITVDKNTTTITNDNIKDLRVLNQGGASGSGGGTFGRYIKEFTSQTTVNINHNLADDEPNVFVYDDNDTLIIPESVTVNDINNLTVTFSANTSGKIIVYGGIGLNNAYYTEEFNSSLTWNVNHNLNNKYVNVTCFNTSDEIIEPSNITITDENNLTIDWGSNTAGRVVVIGGTAKIELSKMTDVNILSPTNNDLLQYDSVNGKWINSSSVLYANAPIGSVVAWLKNLTNTPSLPDNWVECNGQTINDSDSPYNGITLPDLNGNSSDKKFLRGSTTSGGTGGTETHSHTGSLPGTGAHQVMYGNTSSGYRKPDFSTSSANHLPPYYEVVWIIRIK